MLAGARWRVEPDAGGARRWHARRRHLKCRTAKAPGCSALHSLTAALFGQRAIMLGLDPIPVVKHDGGDTSGDVGP